MALMSLSVGRVQMRSVNQPLHQSLQMQRSLRPSTFLSLAVKISTNPGASTSHSINRPTYSLQDVDGDGYLDIVESEKESELKVTRSAIGGTNMLKSVTNSLGGTFTLDYAYHSYLRTSWWQVGNVCPYR